MNPEDIDINDVFDVVKLDLLIENHEGKLVRPHLVAEVDSSSRLIKAVRVVCPPNCGMDTKALTENDS